MANESVSFVSSNSTTNLSSIFVAPKKAIFTAFGSTRLLCYDQVFGYIVNVTKDKEPTYTCAGVLAFTPFPDDEEVADIKINADLTKAVLIGKRYIYCFSIPDTRVICGPYRAVTSTKNTNDDLMTNRISVTLNTLGAFPNHLNILKATWLNSTAVKQSYRYADFIGILYSDSTVRVIDIKYPQHEYDFDFKSAIHGLVKEEQFKGMGLSKTIVAFDFYPVFVDNELISVVAVDNETELYYASLSTWGSNINILPIIGPVLFQNANPYLDAKDITFIKHPHSDYLSLFALVLDGGTITHLLACPSRSYTSMLTGNECLSFYAHDSVNLQLASSFRIINDCSTPGEYLVETSNNIYMVSTLPWLTEMVSALHCDDYISKDYSSLVLSVFHLRYGCVDFQSAVILSDPPISGDYDRYVFAYDSDGNLHYNLSPVENYSITKSLTIQTATPGLEFSANDKFANGTHPELSEAEKEVFREELKKTEDEINTNRQLTISLQLHVAWLKRELGISPLTEITEELNQGLKNVKDSQAYQKTSEVVAGTADTVATKLGELKNSAFYKSFESKLGSAFTQAKMAASTSIDHLNQAARGGAPPSQAQTPQAEHSNSFFQIVKRNFDFSKPRLILPPSPPNTYQRKQRKMPVSPPPTQSKKLKLDSIL